MIDQYWCWWNMTHHTIDIDPREENGYHATTSLVGSMFGPVVAKFYSWQFFHLTKVASQTKRANELSLRCQRRSWLWEAPTKSVNTGKSFFYYVCRSDYYILYFQKIGYFNLTFKSFQCWQIFVGGRLYPPHCSDSCFVNFWRTFFIKFLMKISVVFFNCVVGNCASS